MGRFGFPVSLSSTLGLLALAGVLAFVVSSPDIAPAQEAEQPAPDAETPDTDEAPPIEEGSAPDDSDTGQGDSDDGNAKSNPLALGSEGIYEDSLKALTILFVLAVLLENAFAVVFNSRIFLTYFSVRGLKTPFMIIVSLVIVNSFDVDVVAAIVAAYKSAGGAAVDPAPTGLSMFVTALILSGGSGGVYNVMVALGYRNEREQAKVDPKPPQDKAWFAIRAQGKADGIMVGLKPLGAAAGDPNAPAPIAGAIGGRVPSLFELLTRNPNRYPPNGGRTVEAGTIYQITVSGTVDGSEITKLDKKCVFAPGAIVDFDVDFSS